MHSLFRNNFKNPNLQRKASNPRCLLHQHSSIERLPEILYQICSIFNPDRHANQ